MNDLDAIRKGSETVDLMALQEKERAIVEFVESRMTDSHGLVVSHLHANTLRPWTQSQVDSELSGLAFYDVRRGDATGQLAYEDSLMATGEYALSRILKYAVTSEAMSLSRASVQVGALLRVFEEGSKYERGFLPKPHGGVSRAAFSHEISVDQHIKTLVALRAWQPYASVSQAQLIDGHLVALADYHLVRNFVHPRRESFIVTPENRTHGAALFIPLLWTAFGITGDSQYRKAITRFDGVIDSLVNGPVPTNCNIVSLFMDGLDLAMREGYSDPRLLTLLSRLWEARLAESRKLGIWNDDPTDAHPSSRAIRIAAFAPIVDRHVKGAGACHLGALMLAQRTDPREMRYIDAPASELPITHQYRSKSLCETSITSWLCAYWGIRLATRSGSASGDNACSPSGGAA